jgi:hypothetical protein
LAVMMIDGLELQGRTNVVALGITTEGVKIPLGLWEGWTENATVATALLSDLVERGLDPEQGILFVIDGAKPLRKAIRNVFGEAPVRRCVRHKERNVLDHLPERERPQVKQRLRRAWALRVDDRDRPPHPAEREALVLGRDGAALDRRRHARSRTARFDGSSATATSPPSSSRSNATPSTAAQLKPQATRRRLSSQPSDRSHRDRHQRQSRTRADILLTPPRARMRLL